MASDGRGNFGNPEQHARAGAMSSGNTGNPEQHAAAGRLGNKAQSKAAKAKGGRNSHRSSRSNAANS